MTDLPRTVLRPIWPEELDRDDRRSLDPGADGILERPDVLVVGGGVVGVLTALACLRAELGRVLLIEQSTLASGASGGAAGLLTPEAHLGVDPDPFVALARAGYEGWREHEATVPGGVGVVDLDWVNLEPALFSESARPFPPGAERLSESDVAALLPALATPVPGVRLRQARVNPVRAIARLIGSAPDTLSVASGVAARSVTVAAGRVAAVETTAGPIAPGVVVFATGQPPTVSGLGVHVPSELVKGHMILTGAIEAPWPGSVAPLGTDIGGGRLLIGGTLDVGDTSPDVRAEMVEAMRAYVASFVAPVAVPAATHAWCCFRPAHPDRLPLIDRVPGIENAWMASGHYRTGIVMAPATGRLLAEWISSSRPPPLAEHFAASRFG